MALRLRGSTSGYAEIDAPAVAGDVTLTLPSTTGTINVKDASGNTNVGTGVNLGNPGANIFTIDTNGSERLRIAADGTVSIPGALNVSGVLTYEDVTSVDAIGLSTFRDGLNTKDVGITTISTSVSDTAVDVFIYDTSKDSDGGAWRKRTSHTSWYNETLNTATRGSRREFPSVAVIVATAASTRRRLIIYDGDDPNLPMWMVVDSTDGQWHQTETASPIYALNGIIVIGSSSDGQPLYATRNRLDLFNFISDKIEGSTGSAFYNGVIKGISNRSDVAVQNKHIGDNPYTLVSYRINDLAMTVLPNAPIDDTTGLPIPTIAVATDGGVSVIKDDRTVVDLVQNHAEANKVKHIDFDSETNAILWTTDYVTGGTSTADSYKLNVNPIPSSDITTGGAVVGNFQDWNRTVQSLSNLTKPHIQGDNITEFISNGGNGSYAISSNGTNQCLNLLYEFPGSTVGSTDELNAMVAYATTSYNTGYMPGDIKGAFLSGISTASVTGTTTYSDSFDNNDNGWSFADNGSSGISGGVMTIEQNSNARATDGDALSGVASGTKLSITFTIATGGTGDLVLDDDGAGAGAGGNTTIITATSTGTFSAIYTKTVSDKLRFLRSTGSGNYTISEITIKPIQEEDRSVNNNGLAVYGTITKSAVATGADLVAYSGFSNSNYLQQPYNSDMQTGTGGFSVTAWFNTTSTASEYEGLIYYNRPGSIGEGFQIMMNNSDKGLYFYVYGPTNDVNTVEITGLNNGNWHQIVATHTNGSQQLFIDGVLKSTKAVTTGSMNDSEAQLHIGRWYGNADVSNYWWRGSISLVRHSASIPSAEQVKKIYEDEKVLFQENSNATLYGSSDAVTALAYDEVTDQLHVGTSSGRSDFQGLRRINNTTDPVTTAISAHDTFIIEQ
jgi:hypothetical protein